MITFSAISNSNIPTRLRQSRIITTWSFEIWILTRLSSADCRAVCLLRSASYQLRKNSRHALCSRDFSRHKPDAATQLWSAHLHIVTKQISSDISFFSLLSISYPVQWKYLLHIWMNLLVCFVDTLWTFITGNCINFYRFLRKLTSCNLPKKCFRNFLPSSVSDMYHWLHSLRNISYKHFTARMHKAHEFLTSKFVSRKTEVSITTSHWELCKNLTVLQTLIPVSSLYRCKIW